MVFLLEVMALLRFVNNYKCGGSIKGWRGRRGAPSLLLISVNSLLTVARDYDNMLFQM